MAYIEDAPPLISVLGNRHLLTKKAIAVVGARNASANGLNFAERIARDLGTGGLLVVSGLARGIDVVYPKENAGLYDKIKEQGAIISEVAAGTQPQARHFPRRNRLISGIARGVVVVEASPRSGSLITARMALEQNREVFAVPGAAVDPRAKGTNHLIRQGAILTESADDVLQALNDAERAPLKDMEDIDFKRISLEPPTLDGLGPARGEVEKSLSPAPTLVDEIIRNCQCSPPRRVLGAPGIGVGGSFRTSSGQSGFADKKVKNPTENHV